MASPSRPFALVTGASSGIGYHLARICAEQGHDLLIAADRPAIRQAADDFRQLGVEVDAVESTSRRSTVSTGCMPPPRGRPIDCLLANAGHGLGKSFLDQDFDEARFVIDTNITGTVYLLHKVGRENKLQVAAAHVTPDTVLAEAHRKQAEPAWPSTRGSRWQPDCRPTTATI